MVKQDALENLIRKVVGAQEQIQQLLVRGVKEIVADYGGKLELPYPVTMDHVSVSFGTGCTEHELIHVSSVESACGELLLVGDINGVHDDWEISSVSVCSLVELVCVILEKEKEND